MKLFYSLVLLSVLSCARPQYLKNNNYNQDDPSSKNEAKLGCDLMFQKNSTCLYWYWEKKPLTTKDKGILIFKTYRLNQYDQTSVEMDIEGDLNFVLWMPSMNHGSIPTKITRLDVGTFRVENILFIMPGEWEFQFQIEDQHKSVDEVRVQILF